MITFPLFFMGRRHFHARLVAIWRIAVHFEQLMGDLGKNKVGVQTTIVGLYTYR